MSEVIRHVNDILHANIQSLEDPGWIGILAPSFLAWDDGQRMKFFKAVSVVGPDFVVPASSDPCAMVYAMQEQIVKCAQFAIETGLAAIEGWMNNGTMGTEHVTQVYNIESLPTLATSNINAARVLVRVAEACGERGANGDTAVQISISITVSWR